jgi:hypothetical protein
LLQRRRATGVFRSGRATPVRFGLFDALWFDKIANRGKQYLDPQAHMDECEGYRKGNADAFKTTAAFEVLEGTHLVS